MKKSAAGTTGKTYAGLDVSLKETASPRRATLSARKKGPPAKKRRKKAG
jgi:hypothetical protein